MRQVLLHIIGFCCNGRIRSFRSKQVSCYLRGLSSHKDDEATGLNLLLQVWACEKSALVVLTLVSRNLFLVEANSIRRTRTLIYGDFRELGFHKDPMQVISTPNYGCESPIGNLVDRQLFLERYYERQYVWQYQYHGCTMVFNLWPLSSRVVTMELYIIPLPPPTDIDPPPHTNPVLSTPSVFFHCNSYFPNLLMLSRISRSRPKVVVRCGSQRRERKFSRSVSSPQASTARHHLQLASSRDLHLHIPSNASVSQPTPKLP